MTHIDDLVRNEDLLRDFIQMIQSYPTDYPVSKMPEYDYLKQKYDICVEQLRGDIYRIQYGVKDD